MSFLDLSWIELYSYEWAKIKPDIIALGYDQKHSRDSIKKGLEKKLLKGFLMHWLNLKINMKML